MSVDERVALLDPSRLTINVALNLAGQVLPLAAAVALLPLLIHGLGEERFGALALVWLIVGYFSLFDLGLSRALARHAAESLGKGLPEQVPVAFWTSALLMSGLSVLAAIVSALEVPWLVGDVLHLRSSFATEATAAFNIACWTIPVVVLSGTLRGLLEARQLFATLTLIRIPSGLWNFVGPAALLPFTSALPPVVLILAIGRLVAFAALARSVRLAYPGIWPIQMNRALVRPLVASGLWMTISSLLAPLMLTGDRFLIASIISVGAVTFYATPYEAVTRLWVFTGALTTVLYPAFATSAAMDSAMSRFLYTRGVRYLMIVLTPFIVLVMGFSSELLRLWLGPTFAEQSSLTLQVLAIGVLFSSFALIPFTFLQATARPAIPALMQLLEFPLYVAVTVSAIQTAGISGAAAAWTARIIADAALLALIANRSLKLRWYGLGPFGTLAILVPMVLVPDGVRFVVALATTIVFATFSWMVWLSDAERRRLWAVMTALVRQVNRSA